MVRRGEVVRKEGGRVFIRLGARAECDRCGLCPTGDGGLVESGESWLEPGDRVEVEMPEAEVLGAVFRLYLLPALVFFFSFLLAALFLSEARALVAAFFCLGLFGLFARRRAGREKPVTVLKKIEN